MTEILLIRHGETAWNAIKRLQGHLDIPLNAEGERQAAALGRSLASARLDAVFSSDLQRARQTAAAIAGHHGLPVRSDAGLRERCYGAFEGMLYAEISKRYPQSFAAWKARDIDARFPPGVHVAETMREFAARTIDAIKRIAGDGRHQRIAMVAHGGVLECAYRAAQNMDFAQERSFDIFNASVNRFSWNGSELKLLQWGDVSHLAKLDVSTLDEVAR
ncbi:histidine phosphatase family protein [Noviherbaspirillum sp. CPCC 100848]|uniref:Histidine phosphatase family protein n=1 Tax=Noviherbaspirillum album TaxID=3080276 RepID=A0ABU6JG68_9BURK|nr:histidine phosphatase family protein [Noviherbaspirillum sp. CPCC 100848]MEC4722520.1 histidine phosphatase family protein [Noviherbaspirillum sp. CPCC 100848]